MTGAQAGSGDHDRDMPARDRGHGQRIQGQVRRPAVLSLRSRPLAACAAAAVAALAVLVHPAFLILSILVVLIGWSRVVVKGHTIGQVVVGAVVGAAVAAVVSAALS